jgi:hypothetical protein
MRAPGRGILRRLSVPKSISNKCSIGWRCTLKICSPQWHAWGRAQVVLPVEIAPPTWPTRC